MIRFLFHAIPKKNKSFKLPIITISYEFQKKNKLKVEPGSNLKRIQCLKKHEKKSRQVYIKFNFESKWAKNLGSIKLQF